MAYEQLTIGAISLASGAVLAQQDVPGIESLLDKAGVAGIAIAVVWWMLTSFSKRLDKLTEAIGALTEIHKEKKE